MNNLIYLSLALSNQQLFISKKTWKMLVICFDEFVLNRNVSTNALTDPVVLTGTDSEDCITSSCICDIDLDGKNEILLGTFGKTCFICRVPIGNYKLNTADGLLFTNETFPVCRVLTFSASVFSIVACDLTNDGLDEIIIATTLGLHIYQLELDEVIKLVKKRLDRKEHI